jgi:hypothetical protein
MLSRAPVPFVFPSFYVRRSSIPSSTDRFCAVCRSDEKRLLEAKQAYKKGAPFLSDAEYDALKARLVGSSVFLLPRAGPACTLGKPDEPRGKKQAEAQADWVKMAALTIPPPLIVRRRQRLLCQHPLCTRCFHGAVPVAVAAVWLCMHLSAKQS